jgi:hypothetical protein
MRQIQSSLIALAPRRRSRRHNIKRRISIALLTIAALASNLLAGQLVNVDQNGMALQGYDPVTYFTDRRPAKGTQELAASYNGATYYFASADAFQIIHGQLVLQKNKDILKRWQEGSEGNFQKADANWPQIVQRNAEKK